MEVVSEVGTTGQRYSELLAEKSVATYVEAPEEYPGDRVSVFLAGGITDCPDWQSRAARALSDLPIAILNPRRANFPTDDRGASLKQINWEFRNLWSAGVVLFWFPASSSAQPIAMYELGVQSQRPQPIVVGVETGYLRAFDVVAQLALARPEVLVAISFEMLIRQARQVIREEVQREADSQGVL